MNQGLLSLANCYKLWSKTINYDAFQNIPKENIEHFITVNSSMK